MARDEKRRDTGEFYPGGKVWVKPGQSQPQVHVTWQQIEGKPQIAPLPDRYKDSDVKGKINEIASKFATVMVAGLIGWTACADITVQKKRKDQIYNDEQVVVDVSGDDVGMKTNAVIDIANATIATNPVVAAKLDGPTVAPTNTAEAAGKAADAKATGDALAGKLDNGGNPDFPFTASDISASGDIASYGDISANFEVSAHGGMHNLSAKANRPTSYSTGNLAALDENGNLADSGKTVDDFLAKDEDGQVEDAVFPDPYDGLKINPGGLGVQSFAFWLRSGEWFDYTVTFLDVYYFQKITCGNIEVGNDGYGSADITPIISATNPTFSNAVLQTVVASLSTNITAEVYIAATNACANLGIDPSLIPGEGTIGTVGGLIVTLFAVVFWMKRKIFDNGGKVNDEFAGELLAKQVAINALHYALYSVPTTGADANKLKDRAVNAFTFSGGSLPTFPAQVTGYARDFLLNVTATADGSNITIPEPDGSTATSIGDALAFTANKTYLVAITEIATKHYYIRVIDTTPANAA